MAEITKLACNEVWGGNGSVDDSFDLPALRATVFCRPHRDADAGGDLHYLSSCGTGRFLRVMLADAMGHGSDAAPLAGYLRDLMRQFLNHLEPHSLASRVNELFNTRADNEDNFATAVILTFFSPTGEVTLCNAGHPAPAIYRRNASRWEFVARTSETAQPENLPLGVLLTGNYTERELTLEPGDVVLLYTDGVIEATDPAGQQIGQAGLEAVLNDLGDPAGLADIAELPRKLTERLESQGISLDGDDVSIVALQCTGRCNGAPGREKLSGLLKLFTDLAHGRDVPKPELNLRTVGGAFLPPLNRCKPARPRHSKASPDD